MKVELFVILFFLSILRCQPSSRQYLMTSTAYPSAPSIETIEKSTHAHIRGLHLCNDLVGWASGTKGTIMKMTDGLQWSVMSPIGYEHLDFRDIHGFDANNAVAMAAGDEGRIIRTEDGGVTWTEVYTNLEAGVFLDGLDFDGKRGFCIGDPINGRNLILYSQDQGRTWQNVEPKTLGFAIPGEGSYAASGTTVITRDGHTYAAYGGDSLIRVLSNAGYLQAWSSTSAPLKIGAGCGIFSMAFKSAQFGVAVGGCYMDSTAIEGNIAITKNKGKSWIIPKGTPPRGYRSCVAYNQNQSVFLCCGRTGVDISYTSGYSWTPLSDEGYYTCALADSSGWLMGRSGKIAKITW